MIPGLSARLASWLRHACVVVCRWLHLSMADHGVGQSERSDRQHESDSITDSWQVDDPGSWALCPWHLRSARVRVRERMAPGGEPTSLPTGFSLLVALSGQTGLVLHDPEGRVSGSPVVAGAYCCRARSGGHGPRGLSCGAAAGAIRRVLARPCRRCRYAGHVLSGSELRAEPQSKGRSVPAGGRSRRHRRVVGLPALRSSRSCSSGRSRSPPSPDTSSPPRRTSQSLPTGPTWLPRWRTCSSPTGLLRRRPLPHDSNGSLPRLPRCRSWSRPDQDPSGGGQSVVTR